MFQAMQSGGLKYWHTFLLKPHLQTGLPTQLQIQSLAKADHLIKLRPLLHTDIKFIIILKLLNHIMVQQAIVVKSLSKIPTTLW